MGPNWGRQDPGGPHVGPMNLMFYSGACSAVFNILLYKKCYDTARPYLGNATKWDVTTQPGLTTSDHEQLSGEDSGYRRYGAVVEIYIL